MIANETYKGVHYYGKRSKKENRELIERKVPAIVSEETWEIAQKVLQENLIEASRNARHKYLLRGLVKCGICGLTFSGVRYKEISYYACNGKVTYRGPILGRCGAKNIPVEWLDKIVWDDCVEFISNPESALSRLEEAIVTHKQRRDSIESELSIVRTTIASKTDEKQAILDLYRKKMIKFSDVEMQLSAIAQEVEVLQTQYTSLERQQKDEQPKQDHIDSAKTYLEHLQKLINLDDSYETKREIVKSLVDRIAVDTFEGENGKPQAKVSVHYTFSQVTTHTDKGS